MGAQGGDAAANAPLGEALLVVLRLAHALAAALWVGGALVYALGAQPPSAPTAAVLRETFAAGVGVFVLTGAVLAFDRLSAPGLPPTYVAVLGLKLLLGVWMFSLARRIGSSAPARFGLSPRWQLTIVGIAIYGLAIVLRVIYEGALRP